MQRRTKIPLFSLDRPLTDGDVRRYRQELTALQGNILKVHGRDTTVSIFLTFKAGKLNEVRQFVGRLAERVTSANEQAAQTQRLKARSRTPKRQELFTTLWLSAAGYRYLKCDMSGFSMAFQKGMRRARKRLGDPPTATWDPKFRKTIHAMVTFAHADVQELANELDDLRCRAEPLAFVSFEHGLAMRHQEWTFEHFGFLDGLSQPAFFAKDVRAEQSDVNWRSAAGPNLVLMKDPHGRSNVECGSYFVFRKLEQHVKAFRRWEQHMQAQRHVRNADLAGAILMGRFRDGTPLALSNHMNGTVHNNFTYDLDRPGNRCPLFAHIRKVNPRGDSRELDVVEKSHRIARRGITYGRPTPASGSERDWPEQGVGLLFQCCQAKLEDQFEFLQKSANDPQADRLGCGPDAVIGHSGEGCVSVPGAWGDSRRTEVEVSQFVRMCGGEYFFAPSIPVLKRFRSMLRTR
jgi:Dyp-type peroxidase family